MRQRGNISLPRFRHQSLLRIAGCPGAANEEHEWEEKAWKADGPSWAGAAGGMAEIVIIRWE